MRLKKTCNIIRFLFLLFREVNYNCILSLLTFQLWIVFWNIYKIPSNCWRQHFISFLPCNVVNIIEFFRYIILMSIGDTRVIYISTVSLRTPKPFSIYFVELISEFHFFYQWPYPNHLPPVPLNIKHYTHPNHWSIYVAELYNKNQSMKRTSPLFDYSTWDIFRTCQTRLYSLSSQADVVSMQQMFCSNCGTPEMNIAPILFKSDPRKVK